MTMLTVDVYSDVVCPWCFLGQRRFEAARRARPAVNIGVRWRPFELNPDLPPEGADREAYLAAKFGDPGRLRDAQRRLVEFGRAEGIDFRFEAISRMPNTRAAHVLVATSGDRQEQVVERLFRAYFEACLDVGDLAVLESIAADAGLDPAALRRRLAEPATVAEVVAAERRAAELGINGVPFFVFADRWAVSGAQATSSFVAAIDQVAAELRPAGDDGPVR